MVLKAAELERAHHNINPYGLWILDGLLNVPIIWLTCKTCIEFTKRFWTPCTKQSASLLAMKINVAGNCTVLEADVPKYFFYQLGSFLASKFMQASCLFWPLCKWFLDVHSILLVPDLRPSLDAEVPDIRSCNYSHTCSHCHHKTALEQAEAKRDSATSTRSPVPHSDPLLYA